MALTGEVKLLRHLDDAIEMLQDARANGEDLAIDLETTGLSPWRDKIAVLGLYRASTDEASILHFPARSGHYDWHNNPTLPDVLVQELSHPDNSFIAHNAIGFDMYFLHANGVDIFSPEWFDTLVAEGVCVKAARRDVRVSLGAAYKRRLGKDLKKKIDHRTWLADTLSVEQLGYVANDIRYLPMLKLSQLKEISGEGDTRQKAMAMEQRLLKPVAQMTINGLPLDRPAFEWYVGNMGKYTEVLLQKLRELVDMPDLNINSPVQLKKAFAKFGLDTQTTQAEYLKMVRNGHHDPRVRQLASLILTTRTASKRNNLYDREWLSKFVYKDDDDVDVVRARYWSVGTDTGRFSSSDPNLQQIAQDLRTFFGRVPHHSCITIDYSGLEIVIAGWLSGDVALLEACRSGDVHRSVASQIFGVPFEDVTSEQRKIAKASTFTFLFGGTSRLLHQNARATGSNMTLQEAEDFEYQFFSTFQGMARARASANARARTGRPVSVTLPSGLIRHLAGDSLKPTTLLNTAVQGSASAGLKHAILRLYDAGFGKYLRSTVHDELVFVVPEEQAEELGPVFKNIMEEGMKSVFPGQIDGHEIPIKAELTILPHWKGGAPLDFEKLLNGSGLEELFADEGEEFADEGM